MAEEFSIFCGNANRRLAEAVGRAAGVPLGAATVERFPDGEVSLEIRLLAFADGCRRACAARITAIVPCFGYARSDKRHGRREPIGARSDVGSHASAAG
jgi:ribose-phosphate pyrophosphokinase